MTDLAQIAPLDPEMTIRPGYRLLRLEIKNFGGYHGPASVFHLDLQGAVFSGDNGAGKSTAIDAYRMLFRTYPSFNSATEGAKDRSAETYYIGQYGKKDGAGGSKPMHLRDYGVKKGYMAICGVFQTDDGQTFSALRMGFYSKKGDGAEWRLVTAHADISIERDFPEWPTKGNCARTAQALGGELHPGYKEFFAAIGIAFGIDDPQQATEAFKFIDQSIGVKKLGSIASFARKNIFPHNSLRQSADGAIQSFEKVQESTRKIKQAKAMIKELTAVTRKFGFYENALGSHAESSRRMARFAQFSQLMSLCSSGRILRRSQARLDEIETSLNNAETTIAAAEAEIAAIDATMSSKGFDKVNDLKNQKQKLLTRITRLQAELDRIEAIFAAASMPFDGSTKASFEASFAKVTQRIAELDAQISENQEGERTAEFDMRKADEAKREAAGALEELLRNKSALDPKLIRARNKIAEALQMRPDEMPFVAELAQVRAEDLEWEGVANRVLGGIGTQILVETQNLAAARRFIKGSHFGAKIVLHEVKTLQAGTSADLDPDALAHKIEIKAGDRFEHVARSMIDQAADHICMDALEFETTSARFAVIKEGAVKNGLKTVKDDRSRIDDRSKYILGWNVQDRIDLATAELAAREADLARKTELRDEYRAGLQTLQTRRDAANRLLGAQVDFDSIDVASAASQLASIDAAIAALDTNEAEELRARRVLASKRKTEASSERDIFNRKKGAAEGTIKNASAEIERRKGRLEAERDLHGPATLEQRRYYMEVMRKIAGIPNGASVFKHVLDTKEVELDSFLTEVRQKIETANNSAMNIHSQASQTSKAAEKFMREFPEADLSVDVVADDFENAVQVSRAAAVRDEWRARLDKLQRDDLPRHEAAFEERRQAFAIEAVQQIKSEANSYARNIKKLEEGFNAILSGLTYDPMEGTRARLRIHPKTENEAVRRFRSKLDRGASMVFHDDHEELERVVQELIDEIKVDGDSSSAKDRREAILDLRNWHTMDVEEYYVDENGEYTEQRRIYAGQDGASGGQGERLTMLLIGAAMVYTFGAGDESRHAVGLQTIMLDEAFMHGSEEMAAAATDVLDAMGLQVIAATPVQKLQAFAGKTERVFSISKKNEQILHIDSTYAELEEREKRIAAAFEAA